MAIQYLRSIKSVVRSHELGVNKLRVKFFIIRQKIYREVAMSARKAEFWDFEVQAFSCLSGEESVGVAAS